MHFCNVNAIIGGVCFCMRSDVSALECVGEWMITRHHYHQSAPFCVKRGLDPLREHSTVF